MGQDQQRPFAAVALEARDKVGAIGVEREGAGGNSLGLKRLAEVIDSLRLVAGRAARVDADERPIAVENLGFLFFEIDFAGLGKRWQGQQGREPKDLHDT